MARCQYLCSMAQKMKVDVWSDVVCPFCYIGKRHYEAAMAKFAHAADVETEWHSFQLNPDFKAPAQPENIYAFLARVKNIPYDQSVKMHQQVAVMASAAGLHYNFDKVVPAGTFAAHRVLQMAKKKGVGARAEEALFKAYFTEGRNLNSTDELATIAAGTGLDAQAVKQMLAGKEYAADVQADIDEATRLGVSGVPFFVFHHRFAVSGAQPADTFLNVLEKAWKAWKAEQP